MHAAQDAISEIPTADFLLVEELVAVPEREESGRETRRRPKAPRTAPNARHYFFHTLIGRMANDALARVIAHRLGKLRSGNAVATPHDYGFILTVTPAQYFTAEEMPELLDPEGFEAAVHEADVVVVVRVLAERLPVDRVRLVEVAVEAVHRVEPVAVVPFGEGRDPVTERGRLA